MTAVATPVSLAPARPARVARPAAPRHALPAPAAQVRLTRRGRFVLRGLPLLAGVAALTVGLVILAGLLLSPGAATAETSGAPLATVTVVPGDTLWTVAARVAPEGDRFQTMSRIADLNDLHGRGLQAGQTLYVPSVR